VPGGTLLAPAPPPGGGGGRRTAVVVAAATLVVALIAGGVVYALTRGDDRLTRADHGSGSSASASGAPSPSASDTGPAKKETAEAPQPGEGAVPEEFLGEWSAVIENASGSNPRHITLAQGEVGDPVLTLVAEGPLAGTSSSYRCVFTADLVESPGSDGTLRLGPSRVLEGAPLSSCSAGDPSTLTLDPAGALTRRMDTGDALTYHR
jgi:hypothetical protein